MHMAPRSLIDAAAARFLTCPIVAARSNGVVIMTCACTIVLALRLVNLCPGELHALINNVGINIRKPTLQYTAADVQTLLSVNLASAFHLSQLCYPQLQAADNASVLFMSSVAGGPLAMKSGCVYAMTKGAAALNAFSCTLQRNRCKLLRSLSSAKRNPTARHEQLLALM